MSYKLGLVSVSFRGHTPGEILSAMECEKLEFIEWGSDIHVPESGISTDEICALQEKYKIKCSSYGTYFRLGETPISGLYDYIKTAKKLGTDILRLWCGNKNSEDYTNEEKALLFSECKAASKIAEENGVILCLECHNNTYTNRKEAASELMEAVSSPAFKMYWQPNQFKTTEENLAYARLISPHVKVIHVFNWKGNEMLPLKDATDIWREYLKCFSGNQYLLLEFMPDGKIETLKTEADALKEIIL